MSSLQTLFRTIIMLATLGIVAKVWFLHGPSVDEMKAIGTRVAEVASQAWSDYWQQPVNDALADDPRLPAMGGAPAPFVPPSTPVEIMPHSTSPISPRGASVVQLAGGVPAEMVPVAPADRSMPWGPPESPGAAPQVAALVPEQDTRLRVLFEQLAKLGVRDQELAPWGSRGELMRFHCSVPWANSPAYSRHFEAVAATPLGAVEQVVAEIEAWQRGQR